MEIIHYDIAVLPGWVDVSVIPNWGFTQLKAPSTFPTDSLFTLFLFIQSTVHDDGIVRTERNRTVWNPIVNASGATVNNRSINEGVAWCLSTTRVLQDYLEKDCARGWVAKRRALLDFSLE